MDLLVLSAPGPVADEARLMSEMLAAGLRRLHLRKPDFSRNEMADFIARIPARFYSRLVLHSHHELAAELGLGGLHLTAASRAKWARRPLKLRPGQSLSTSFHSLAEIRQHRRWYSYVFLSPVFDSLSKLDYPAAFDLTTVAHELRILHQRAGYVPQVVALGGIESHRLAAVREAGFAGAAVLGAVWQSADPVAAFRALQSVVG